MKTLLSALAMGLVAFTAADHADAAPLNYVKGAPTIEVPLAVADYIEFGTIGDLSIFGAEGVSVDFSPAGILLFDVLVDFDPVNPSATAGGGIFAEDDDGAFLDGALVKAGFDGDVLQLLFGDLTGSAAGDFGRFALMELVFLDPFPGTNPLSNLVDGTGYEAFATVYSATPIPLPAALPLMGAALGGLVLLRRRR